MAELSELRLSDLQPSQFWISERKLADVNEWFRTDDLSSFEPLPVKILDGIPVLTDGHTRALAAWMAGLEIVPLVNETDELDWDLYRLCVSACRERGVFSPADLIGRVLYEEDYRREWDGWCDRLHAETIRKRVAVAEQAPSDKLIEELIRLSEDWEKEDSCHGYRANAKADIDGNRIFTAKDGGEVIQHDGTAWLLHDPAFMDFYACLIPLLQEQKSDVPQYSESNFQAYMQKAEAGDAAAMYAVGYLYYYGQGTEQDADKALEWFEKAAEAGSGDGFGMLGYIYDVGEGVPEDPAKAFEYYQKAADLNSGFAIYNLAIMYLKGKYVEEDPEMAKELFIRSAQTGFDAAIEYVKETYPEEYQLLENAVGQ